MFNYLLQRAQEPSSWRGAVLLATAAGVNVAPDMLNAIVTAGLGLAGLIGVITKDNQAKKK